MIIEHKKAIICSIVCWDIVGYSKKPDAEQMALKSQFIELVNNVLEDTKDDEHFMSDTGDGASIAFVGSPEDALYIAIQIRESVLEANRDSLLPLELRVGINLGAVRIVEDLNGRPKIIGDGINVAHSMMNFAKLHEILVTRSFHEATSRLTKELSEMFNESVVLFDEHGRKHEIYSLRLCTEETDKKYQPLIRYFKFTSIKKFEKEYHFNKFVGLTGFIILLVLFTTANLILAPKSNQVNLINSVSAQSIPIIKNSSISYKLDKTKVTNNNINLANDTDNFKPLNESISIEKSEIQNPIEVKKASHKAKKIINNKLVKVSPMQIAEAQSNSNIDRPNTDYIEPKRDKYSTKLALIIPEDSQHPINLNWKTFKASVHLGGKSECTQSEIAIGQCH